MNIITRGFGNLQKIITRGFGRKLYKKLTPHDFVPEEKHTVEYIFKVLVPIIRKTIYKLDIHNPINIFRYREFMFNQSVSHTNTMSIDMVNPVKNSRLEFMHRVLRLI